MVHIPYFQMEVLTDKKAGEEMQNNISQKIILSTLAVMLILSFIACTTKRGGKRADMEKLLTASGFKMVVADTPEKLAQVKKLPQRKIVPHEEGDKIYYIYADVENCQCAYAGNEEAYKQYQKLASGKQLTEEENRDAKRDQQRQMDWGDWSFDREW
jgi:hypothetical protein